MTTIIIDNKIPYIQGVFEPVASVSYFPGSEISPAHVDDADALIIRTRTRCDQKLLENSKVSFIATATIGHDHIDRNFCQSRDIKWQNAPGCNANSVEQYVATALIKLSKKQNISLSQQTLGVIGVGNTGTRVAKIAELLGLTVLKNDPPRARKEGNRDFVSIEEIQQKATIISLHVPLNRSGIDRTFHLVDSQFINQCQHHISLINTSRGEVVDNQALKHALSEHHLTDAVLDVWENEPNIDRELMDHCLIATPHIAGYAYDGKLKGTQMSVRTVSQFFDLGLNDWEGPDLATFPKMSLHITDSSRSNQEWIHHAIETTYDIMADDLRLRQSPETFERQRGDYPLRREISAFSITTGQAQTKLSKQLKQIGFQVNKSS